MMPENKEVRKLELCDIAPFVPFGLKVMVHESISTIASIQCDNSGLLLVKKVGYKTGNWLSLNDIKPMLRPLDQLTQEITHNGEKLVFTELFEIGDDGGYNYEFDFGNVKLIKHLKKIAEHNIIADIPYLPHQVIKEMLKYHFDISGLFDSGLAIPIHNTK